MNIIYNEESRSFSVSNNVFTIKGPWNFKLVVEQKSALTKLVMNQIELTSYKYRMPVPIDKLSGEYKVRAQKVYDNLKQQCKEVPVIEPCTKFNNACYIGGFDEILRSIPERERDYQLSLFCEDLGCDFESVKKNIGPHMIFMGIKFMSPEVLAHEFGHYLNTIGKGEPDGDKVHAKYGKAVSRARTAQLISIISAITSKLANDNKGRLMPVMLAAASLSIASIPLTSRPVILSEKKASQTGMKNLVKAGASKEDLIEYDKFLKYAFSTYKANYVTNPIIFALLYGSGAALTGYLAANKGKTIKIKGQ